MLHQPLPRDVPPSPEQPHALASDEFVSTILLALIVGASPGEASRGWQT